MTVAQRGPGFGPDVLEYRHGLQGRIGRESDQPLSISNEDVAELVIRQECRVNDVFGRFDDDLVAARGRIRLEQAFAGSVRGEWANSREHVGNDAELPAGGVGAVPASRMAKVSPGVEASRPWQNGHVSRSDSARCRGDEPSSDSGRSDRSGATITHQPLTGSRRNSGADGWVMASETQRWEARRRAATA